ncbi:hypothetical protein HanIR_Chr14g0684771 [Helianthus annuus]|nr:hypothetical protein HanIR_Chr14g0684771 [Helianthus annuus]
MELKGHSLVYSRRVRSTLTRTRTRTRTRAWRGRCGALMAHFALRSHRREPLESRLCIF